MSDTNVSLSGGDTTFDITGAATRVLSVLNSTGSQVANFNLSDGELLTNGVSRLTNAGVLQNITGLTISSGTVSLPAGQIDNSELANSGVTVTAGTGLSGGGTVALGSSVSLASTLGISIDTAEIDLNTITLADVADSLTLDANLTFVSDNATNDYKLVLDNSSTGDVANILAVTTSGTGATITTALDLSDTDITTALALGSNDITVGGVTISSSEFAILDAGLSESEVTGEIEAVTAGNGLAGGGSADSITLDIASANGGIIANANDIALTLTTSADALSLATSSGSGLEVLSAGLTLLQGCSNNQILKWSETTDVWACAADVDTDTDTQGNAFITIDTPSGTDPTADSSTDSFQLLVSGTNLIITGANDPESVTFNIDESVLAGAGLAANSSTVDIGAGNGISVAADSVAVKSLSTADGTGGTSSNSGLEFQGVSNDELTLLQGCANSEVLKWNDSTNVWTCATDTAGGITDGDKGDITVTVSGATWTIDPDSVALGTDTTGNYVASITAGNGISGSSSSEGGTPTLALGALTADWSQTGAFDIVLNNSNSELKILDSNGDATATIDIGNLASDSTFTLSGVSGTILTDANYASTLDGIYINTGESPVAGDISGSFSGGLIINANSVALGTDSTGDYVALFTAGNGLTGDAAGEGSTPTLAVVSANGGIVVNANDIALTLTATADALSSTTSSGSGLEMLSSGLSLLQGCSDSQILKWNETTDVWACGADSAGGISDGDKGDITVTVSGATWTIDNDVVTFAKFQNISTDRILGRDTTGSGDVEELTISGGLEFTGSGGLQTSAFTGDVTKTAGGTALTIAANSVDLTTDTAGNYVASANTSVLTGLSGGSAGSEGAALTLGLDYSQALTGDIGLAANAAVFGQSGLVFEGATANTIETFISIADPTTTDKTITIPNRSGTVALSGDTFTGDVTATLETDGSTILTIAADSIALITDTTGDFVSSFTAGNGLTGDATGEASTPTIAVVSANGGIVINANDIALDASVAGDALSATTSSGSGLEILSSGLTLLQGCSDGQILKWVEASDIWNCAADATGGGGSDLDGVYDTDADKELLIDSTTGLIFDMTTTGDFLIQDSNTTIATFDDSGGITFAPNGTSDFTFTGDGDSSFIMNGGSLLTSSLGVEFTESDTNPGCAAGDYKIYADTSEAKLKKCQNGTASDLDTTGGGGTIIYHRLGANYTNATTTFTTITDGDDDDDKDITFEMGASETWVFEAVVYVNSPTAADYKFQVTAPSGATCVIGVENSEEAVNIGNLACATSTGLIAATAQANDVMRVTGTITTGVTAGQASVQFGQVAASGTSTIYAGSYIVAQKTTGADVAEAYYSHDKGLEPGTVLSIDPTLQAGVKRSTQTYQRGLIGVVSTQPGLILGDPAGGPSAPVLVALAGRVPVKVNTENGPIKAGDYLTSSSTPGVAMRAIKAGSILGQAMGDFDGEGVGKVMTFIQNGVSNGISLNSLLGSTDSSDKQFSLSLLQHLADAQDQSQIALNASEIFTDRIAAGLEIISPKVITKELATNTITSADTESISVDKDLVIAGTLTANKIKANQIEGLEIFTNKLSRLEDDLAQASAKSENLNTNGDKVLSSSTTQNVIPTDLGDITIQNLSVNLDLIVHGAMIVEGPVTFKAAARFEANAIFNGNVAIEGETTFQGQTSFNADTAGFAVINPGQKLVHVAFDRAHRQVPVVSASLSNGKFAAYAVSNVSSSGFDILLQSPATEMLQFSWTALSIKDAKTSVNASLEP